MNEVITPFRLEMQGISKSFPGVQALNNVSLKVLPGEIHALVGENGAGKSTLMKILSGAYPHDTGKILLNGVEIEINCPADALRQGIVMIYQESSLSKELSVAENIFCGHLPRKGLFVNWKKLNKKAKDLLSKLDSNINPHAPVKDLSPAQCQMVEIAKALSLSAQVIVFDEPTAALTKNESETLFKIMRSLKDEGISIIFITHRLAEIFYTSDRITILRDGKLIITDEVINMTEEKVIMNMVGRAVQYHYQRPTIRNSISLLEVESLSGAGFFDINMKIRAGEIVGLFGLIGSGRTEFVRTLFGADQPIAGSIHLEGHYLRFKSPAEAIKAGIVLVPEDRKSQGLVLEMPVRNNISLPNLHSISRMNFIQFKKETEMANVYKEKLNIRCPSILTPTNSLSGGNQQKVVIAKWLAKKPKILIVDEPTKGIDVGAKVEVHQLMIDLANQGVGVLMVSSELPEILAISDRIYVMHEGHLVGEMNHEEATEEIIMTYASGQ